MIASGCQCDGCDFKFVVGVFMLRRSLCSLNHHEVEILMTVSESIYDINA